MRWLKLIVAIGFVWLYVQLGMLPALDAVRSSPQARDYATYHYAGQEALAGGNPYDTKALNVRSRAERTRPNVHPFFYPPPFVLALPWVGGLSLAQGYLVWFWMQQVCLVGLGLVLWAWFRAPLLLLTFVLATFSPIPDNGKMGQANLPVLLIACLGLWRSSGSIVAMAAMAKMSPALYLWTWMVRRQWKPVVVAGLTAVGLSVVALVLVPWQVQLAFYTDILPGFSKGDYHGLAVPITLPANHSIPDLFNQHWGPKKYRLPVEAQRASAVASLLLLGALGFVARHRRDPLGEANMAGALTVLLVITPVYTYEHHLAMLILPIVAVGTAIWKGRLGPGWWLPLGVCYFLLTWPLRWLRDTQDAWGPAWEWWLQESKFFGELGLMALCVAVVLWSPRVAQGTRANPR